MLISNFSLWNLTKRRESGWFFSLLTATRPANENMAHGRTRKSSSPEVSSIICQMWNLYFCTQSLRWCKNTVKLMCDAPNKKSHQAAGNFFLRSWCHRAWESSQRGDLRGNCHRVWDGVTNSPLILMTGKSTEARTRCARTSVSWEAWVVNWTLKSQTVKQQN